jgi:hypothetical protein
MNFNDLNKNRLRFVVMKSIGHLLKEFYEKNQKRLILAKVKVDAIPKGDKALQIFVGMNEKALNIAKEWFLTKLPVEETLDIEAVISKFLLLESGVESFFDDDIDKYCRRVLVELFSDAPNEKILKFMATPILKSDNSPLAKGSLDKPSWSLFDYLKESNFEVDSTSLEALSDEELLMAAIFSKEKSFHLFAVEIKNRAQNFDIETQAIEKLICGISEGKRQKPKTSELIKIKADYLENISDIDPAEVKFIGVIKNIIESGTRFIKVVAILSGDIVYQIDSDQRRQLLPESGDIVWLTKGFRKLLDRDECGIFTVKLSDDNGENRSNKFVVKDFVNQVFPVVECPSDASDATGIRLWFKGHEEQLAASGSYVNLVGNVLIRPHKQGPLAIDFDRPVDIFNGGVLYEISGYQYLVGATPGDEQIDISSPESFFKKIIRSGLADRVNLSKGQITHLIEEFSAISTGQNARKIDDIHSFLDELLIKEETLNSLVGELFKAQRVQAEIEERIERATEKKTAHVNELKNEIISLEQQKKGLKTGLDKDKEQHKKIRQNFSSDLKSTFEKGISDGTKLLADVALFQAFLRSDPAGGRLGEHVLRSGYQCSVRDVSPSDIEKQLAKQLNYSVDDLKRLFKAVNLTQSVGLNISFKGSKARLLADIFADNLGFDSVYSFEIQGGAPAIPEMSKNFFSGQKNSVYLIKNYDLTPISVYAPDILDFNYLRFLTGSAQNEGPFTLLVHEESGIGLKAPDSLNKSMVIIDSDLIDFKDDAMTPDEFRVGLFDAQLSPTVMKTLVLLMNNISKRYDPEKDEEIMALLFGFLNGSYFNRFID